MQLAASQESQPLTGNAEADYDNIGDGGTGHVVQPMQLAEFEVSPQTGNSDADYDHLRDSGTERGLTVVTPV